MTNPATVRFVAPASGKAPTTVEGRQRASSSAAGTAVDVPWGTCDVSEMGANGWCYVCPSGSTANRPTTTPSGGPLPNGYLYLDTTLAYIVVYDGGAWRNPATGASV